MPPVEAIKDDDDVISVTPKPTIGIIYPPPEVRNIVDKTASFVARNGPEFESRIRQTEINNPKFNFLNSSDPYHAYYQHKVKEFKEGKAVEPSAKSGSGFGIHLTNRQQQQELLRQAEPVIPKEPPPDFEFVADPPSISAYDLDVVKLTAQFVARNGRQFLTNLMNKEQRNYQFDFLRPQHSLFTYFTKLVEQYTKVLIPPKDLKQKLEVEAYDSSIVLEKVQHRVDWAKYELRQKRKEEEEAEKERVSYAQVDWHDFVVVEVVDFLPNEGGNLPPPTTPEEVGARIIAQQRFESVVHEPEIVQEVEMDVDDDDDIGNHEKNNFNKDDQQIPLINEKQMQPPIPPTPENVIVKPYDPKASKKIATAATDFVSPLTGEKISGDKISNHVKYSLIDPQWIKQRDQAIADKRDQEIVYAPGSSIDSNLKLLAERRTDIFNVGGELAETDIGKKIGESEDKRPQKVIWDGHTASMERVTQKARENITIDDQIASIHKSGSEDKDKIGPRKQGIVAAPPVTAPSSTISLQPVSTVVRSMTQQAIHLQPSLVMVGRPPMVGIPGPRPMMAAMPLLPAGMTLQQTMSNPMTVHMNDEPMAKKIRTEETLIAENDFLAKNQSPVTFKVMIPHMPDKSEWRLNGQIVSLTLPLKDSISVIKAKLTEELGLPAGKQKLQLDGMFVKDQFSLAFYNFTPGATLQLQLKERGGRKK